MTSALHIPPTPYYVYSDEIRVKLLSDYAFMDRDNIAELHHAATMQDRESALSSTVAGIKVSDIVCDLLARSESEKDVFRPDAQTTKKFVA